MNITLMPANEYRNLVEKYRSSFRGQDRKTIKSRYRACCIAVSQTRAIDPFVLNINPHARFLLANMQAMEDAAPWLD